MLKEMLALEVKPVVRFLFFASFFFFFPIISIHEGATTSAFLFCRMGLYFMTTG